MDRLLMYRNNRVMVRIALLLIAGFAVVLTALAYQQIFHADELLAHSFEDARTIGLMNELIQAGVFKIEDGGIVTDTNLLAQIISATETRTLVKRLSVFVKPAAGRLVFDSNAVRIVRDRQVHDSLAMQIRRGRVLDRKGRVLAETSPDANGHLIRQYPYGVAAFHPVGCDHPRFGRKGVEYYYDEVLAGRYRPETRVKIDRFLGQQTAGDDVVLTIDAEVQRRAYELLGDFVGAVVVLDCGNGDIITMASNPSFDPMESDADWWQHAATEESQPFLNRATSQIYPPGSTFKVVTAAAYLESPGLHDHAVVCQGYNAYHIHCKNPHGKIGWHDALARSCNYFYSGLGAALGAQVRFMAERFGFDAPISLCGGDRGRTWEAVASLSYAWNESVPIYDFQKNLVVNQSVIRRYQSNEFSWNRKEAAQCAIGQNKVAATPLQMALVAAAIAGQGRMPRPRLVESVLRPSGDQTTPAILAEFPATQPERMLSKEAANAIAQAMVDMTRYGTGANLPRLVYSSDRYDALLKSEVNKVSASEISFAGKTGTAEIPHGISHSWFIGFAPAEQPRVAIAVLCEHAGQGALYAGPRAVGILAAALNAMAQ